jgi:hypothetical protein
MWGMSWRGASLYEKFFLTIFFLVIFIRTPVFWFLAVVIGLCVGGGYYLGHTR